MAYDSRMTSALSGATLAQLSYWRRPDRPILVPEMSSEHRVFYSYQDVLAIRILVFVRRRRSLQKIRKAVLNLGRIGMTGHLSGYKLVPHGSDGVAVVPTNGNSGNGHTGVELMGTPGQAVWLGDVIKAFNVEWTRVPPLEHPRKRLAVNPSVRSGFPVVDGTRIDYDIVAGLVRDGVLPSQIREFYPSVSAAAARDAALWADFVDTVSQRQAASR